MRVWPDEIFGLNEKLHKLPRLSGGGTAAIQAVSGKVQGRTNMLQDTNNSAEMWTVSERRNGADSLHALIDRLQQIGFKVPPLCGTQNNMSGGVPMRLSVRKLLRSDTGSENTINTILALLRDHTPLTLSLTDFGRGDAVIDGLLRVCEFLQREIAQNNRCGENIGNNIGICAYWHQLPLQVFQTVAKSFPGNGPRYVLLDSLQMAQHSNRRLESETDQIWSILWRDRAASMPLQPAYGEMVRTECPLLADEVATSVLPVSGIQVPVDSAWLPLSLPLPNFADDAGEIRWDQLLPALASGVELAEKIMDQLYWSQPAQRIDARLNRRLALSITGLGDLVVRRGLDPENLATLRWLSAILLRIRTSLWHRSGQLARNIGCLPALRSSDPSSDWDDSAQRDNWRRRWQVALETSAVRHRNMLVLSPYAVLPSSGACNAGYTDLLPTVAYADAWSFADPPEFSGWNLNQFKVFHRRAWAVIQGCKTGSLVAAGV
jgi:hypothetical protein